MIRTLTLSPAHQVALLAIAADGEAWIHQDAEVLAGLSRQNLIRPIMAWGFCLQASVTDLGWYAVAELLRVNGAVPWYTRELDLDERLDLVPVTRFRAHLAGRAAALLRSHQQAAAFDAIDPDEVARIEMMGGQLV